MRTNNKYDLFHNDFFLWRLFSGHGSRCREWSESLLCAKDCSVLSRYRSVWQKYLTVRMSANINRASVESKLANGLTISFYNQTHLFSSLRLYSKVQYMIIRNLAQFVNLK